MHVALKRADDATKAEEDFIARFVKKEIPDEIEENYLASGNYNLADLMIQTNLVTSKKEAKRLIEQGGVKLNGERVSNTSAEVDLRDVILLQVGKHRFLKVKGS